MRLMLLILLLPIVALGQEDSITEKVRLELMDDFGPYMYEHQKEHFEKALAYEKMDSFENAVKQYIQVLYFDWVTWESIYAKAKLDSFYAIAKGEVLKGLKGEWNWIWDGTDYGVEGDFPSTCQCTKTMIVDDENIIIIEDGKEVQRFLYTVKQNYYSIIWKAFIIEEVESERVNWRFSLHGEEDDDLYYPFPSMREQSEEATQFLLVKYTPQFVCGGSFGKFEKK